MRSLYSLPALFAVLSQALGAKPRSLNGSHHSLPVYAPENQVLLNLESTEIRDTNGATFADSFDQNEIILKELNRLTSMPYLSTFKVDLSDSRCPFDDDSATCANRQCVIEPLSDSEIDEGLFKSQFLGRLRKDSVSKDAPSDNVAGCTSETASLYAFGTGLDRNYCYPEDETNDNGVWVDLTGNLERFTGYKGTHAHLMWSKVYGENCFGYPKSADASMLSPKAESAADKLANVLAHPQKISEELTLPATECIEQRLFYRLLSGMHASISTHLSYDYYNSESEEWEKNLPEWLERVGWHEDRLDNMFFDYVLMSRAVSKLISTYEDLLVFSMSCQTVDTDVRIALKRLGRYLQRSPLVNSLDETAMFASEEGRALKNEFRQRVRNVNALMSCVGCERCRLWGKIQTAGYGTALKILFELPEKPEDDPVAVSEVLADFRRSELVALINTFARISHSVEATKYFLDKSEAQLIDRTSFGYQISLGLRETVNAMSFILNSYLELPRNLGRLALYHMHSYWAWFVGLERQRLTTEIEDLYNGGEFKADL